MLREKIDGENDFVNGTKALQRQGKGIFANQTRN